MKIIGTTITGSVLVNGNDVTTNLQTLNIWSGSVATTIISLNSTTSSLNNVTASLNNDIASLLNYTASNNAAISDILLETASINTFTSSISSRTSIIEGKYATTGSNIFFDNQTISGSLFISQNLVVQGSSSIQNVTASAVSIGTNTVILNTDTPAVRFGGIKVQDSGSGAGVSGSLLWDSLNNHWIYQHPAGGAESGMSARLISGPRNSGSLGNEAGITSGKIIVAVGDDHIGDSIMTQTGTVISVAGDLTATSLTGSINGSQLTNSTVANAKLANSTISGISLGSNLATLTIGTGLSGTSYNGSGAVTIANTGVTSITAGTGISINQGTGGVTVTNTITNTNQLTNGAGYITSAGTSADSNLLNGISSTQIFNNMGNNHSTYTDFNSVGNFGVRYLQGSTNGPGTGASQYYGFTLGLGNDYPLNGAGSYATQFYWNRTSTGGNPYVSVRFKEGNSWGSWSKIYAGYADSAGSASSSTTAAYLSGRDAFTNGSDGWFRSNGQAGWYNQTYAGGIYMIDTTWVRTYNDKYLYSSTYIACGGDITAYYSDERLKKDIVKIDGALAKVMALNGVYYTPNDFAMEQKVEIKQNRKVGVIAQNVQKILPEVVSIAAFDLDENLESKSGENYLTVKYDKLIPVLIEAIKEQQAQIEELKAKLG